MSKLTPDCLLIIFENLVNRSKSLHSCLLVNRLWCEISVPILWRNPWEWESRFSKNNLTSLHNTIILLISSESREFLIKNGIDVFTTPLTKPVFNYISFFKTLDDSSINEMANHLITFPNHNQFQLEYKRFLLEQEIMKLIMSNSPKLKNIFLSNGRIKQFYYFPGAQDCLVNLVNLECHVDVDPLVFYGLAQICHNIKELFIYNCVADNAGIISLIEAQKNLQHFKYETNIFSNTLCKGIGEALRKKAHKFLSFESVDRFAFPPFILTTFINLQVLRLGEKSDDPSYNDYLRNSQFPNLQQLHIHLDTLYNISTIIHSTKGSLWELRTAYELETNSENALLLIKSIKQNCPKLKFTSLFLFDDECVKELENLFSACPLLERIVFNQEVRFRINGDKILDLLIKYTPSNLISVKFENFKFSTKKLESFFEKLEERQISLYFIDMDSNELNSEQKDLMIKYEQEKIIENFQEIDSSDRFFDWDL